MIFEIIDGLGEREKQRWRRFWNWIVKLEPGEVVKVTTLMDRSSPFHRRHFAMQQAIFEAQQRFKTLEEFVLWGKVGAGWVTWAAGPKGGVVPIPRSISYKAADQAEFEEYHALWMDFMLGGHASRYLWPHFKNGAAEDEMFSLLERFQ